MAMRVSFTTHTVSNQPITTDVGCQTNESRVPPETKLGAFKIA